jgi:hypothetical protein
MSVQRDSLLDIGIELSDGPTGSSWTRPTETETGATEGAFEDPFASEQPVEIVDEDDVENVGMSCLVTFRPLRPDTVDPMHVLSLVTHDSEGVWHPLICLICLPRSNHYFVRLGACMCNLQTTSFRMAHTMPT